MNCEGVRGDENVVKMLSVKEVVRKAKDEGLKIMIGGDMNAHIWELDKCENKNGKLLKNMVNETNLQIMNCVWEHMSGPTWFSENSEFTLDYICVDDCALKSVQSAYLLEREEVVESDHAAVGVDVEWKVKRRRKAIKKMRTTRKRRLAVDKWDEYGSQMEQRDYKDLSSMSVAMTQVGVELNEETKKWCENRRGWVSDRVKGCIAQRRSANKNYRCMRKVCGVDDERTERAKDVYLRKKEEASQEVGRALHVHTEMVMEEICKGGNKSGLYGHMKMLIEKGKEANDSNVQLMNEEGETIADEEKVKDIIENFWSDLFCLKGNATYGVKKELVDGGMEKEVWSINVQDLKRAIKLMKVNKATDESGMIAEYIKALGEQDVKNLSVLMNDVLSGESIPKEWKESRVVLVHKGGSKKEVSNYRPIAIINVICKLFMMLIRDSINGWVEESGMLGDVQVFF